MQKVIVSIKRKRPTLKNRELRKGSWSTPVEIFGHLSNLSPTSIVWCMLKNSFGWKFFRETRKSTNRSIVYFVCGIPFRKNCSDIRILQNIREMSTFTQPLITFYESSMVCMNRVEHYFNWNVFKSEGFILGSSIKTIIILPCWNQRKVNFSLSLKCFCTFLIDWFLNCLSRCFKVFFCRAEDVFF